MNIVNPEYTVERIVERMREASADRVPAAGFPTSSTVVHANGELGYDGGPDIKPISFQPTFQPQDQYHINDLLKFSDEQFVENAYRAILKRSADPVGREALLQALRAGQINKIDILARLRYSKEGRAEGVRLDGLAVPAAFRTLYRVPIAGYLLNLAVALVRLPSILRSHRQFEAHVLAHEEILVRHVNHIGQSLINEAQSVAVSQQQILQQLKEENARLISEQTNNHEVLLARIAEFTSFIEERINDEAAQRQQDLQTVSAQQSKDRERADRLIEEAKSEIVKLRGQIDLARAELISQLDQYDQRERRTSAELAMQSLQLSRLASQAQSTIISGTVGAGVDSHLLDAFFASFDEQFRGDRTTIKDRLKVYLAFLPAAEESTVVDIGCGRGEWLELLRDVGIEATGVELNSLLAQSCRDRGLNVVEQDLFVYLATQSSGSLDVLSAFHVVEHLPVEQLVTLLSEAMRVLRPGGVLILETPNPRNVLVGSCNFYFDPTHRNPLPSEVLQLIVETKGFDQIEVLPLNPSDAMPVPGDSEIVNRFNQYFYGPMDYGLIARRP